MDRRNNLMRERIIQSNSQLTSHDFLNCGVGISKNKPARKLNTVNASETHSGYSEGICINDSDIKLSKSINDHSILTDEQRDWIHYAYNEKRKKIHAQLICDRLLIAFKAGFTYKNDMNGRLNSLFMIAAYSLSCEIFKGRKVGNKTERAHVMGISFNSYQRYWDDRYKWAIAYLKKLDNDAIKSLSDKYN